jgi:dTDP-4-dehydrorhamnose 3,5-epimerase
VIVHDRSLTGETIAPGSRFTPFDQETVAARLNTVRIHELTIQGAFRFEPTTFPDERGVFTAPYQASAFVEAVGYPMPLGQTSHSVSRAGVIRGVHFADVPPGQAKYVYCPRGALLDVLVDLRIGSPTFGRWTSVRLDSVDYHAVYLPEGLGHAFLALEDDTTMTYLCGEGHNPGAEHGVNPFDPDLALPWRETLDGRDPVVSAKDRAAPSLAEALAADLLPRFADCQAWYAKLRSS